jgi:pimeloyl-ACP methyl ester carboxylesterase
LTETRRVTSPDGTPIAYRRVGTGPPVVVLHGGLGSWQSWLAVAERLADRFELFLLDRRGRGASGDGTPPHALAREIEDAQAVLGVAGSGAALIGHSYGGAVALETARVADPEQIGRLVLYEPAVRVGGLIPAEEIDRLEWHVAQGLDRDALALGIDLLDAAGLVRADGTRATAAPGAPDELARLAATLPRELRAVAGLGDDLTGHATIAVPTLLLVGASSPPRQQSLCAALANALPEVEVARLHGQGHVAHNGDPDQVARVVGSFLSGR